MDNACLLSGTDVVKFENLVWVPNLYEFTADSRVILGETLHGVFSWANKLICMGRCCFVVFMRNTYMLFTGREVRMGKNCALGLEYGPRPTASGRTQDQGHSFFPYGPT